ncbi:MAG TPA: hypothetical protein VK663_07120, partial [Burkholderiales bacterium]|nr:hypothetical protein [Burkholderiales bacterium]
SRPTTSLGAVIGRDVRPFLPHGPDSLRWHRILTEIQMLLHAHAANDAREADGQVPVNSVWLWGGGTLPPPAPAPFATVWSDDAIVRALAQHSGCPVQSRPAAITVPALEEGSHLFSCELLTACLHRGDVQAWSTAVTALDRDWFMPLLGALKSRRLSTVTLICSTDADTHQFTVRPRDLLKFWRKNKYLE